MRVENVMTDALRDPESHDDPQDATAHGMHAADVVAPVPAERRPCFLVRWRDWVFDGEPPEDARPPGLYRLKAKGRGDNVTLAEERVSGPIDCLALTRTEDREVFGRLLRFRDHDGRERELAVPCSALAGDGRELVSLLLDAGLELVPQRARFLLQYVATRSPDHRVLHVTQTGWLADRSAFVLPHCTVGRSDIVFQCRSEHRATGPSMRGDFRRWRETVGAIAASNPRLAFSIAVALSAPLYGLLGIAPGGFHLWGTTTAGKSTIQNAAASCWGCGDKPFVRGWRGTANGLEGAATLANDLPLFLDEIKEASAADFEAILYFLVNGRGKLRGARDGGLRAVATWRNVIVSNGEYPITRHLRAAGADCPPGLFARIADIRADDGRYGVFDDLCGHATPGELAKALAKAATCDFGHAGPALLEVVMKRRAELQEALDAAIEALAPEGSIARRAAERFAAAAVAAELAVDAAILPWKEGFALDAVRDAFVAWQDGAEVSERAGLSAEDTMIVEALRAFLETQRARFQAPGAPPPPNRAGFVEPDGEGGERFKIFKAALASERTLQRWSHARIAEALDRAGLIAERDTDRGRRWRKAKIEGRQERVLVVRYAPAFEGQAAAA